MVQRGAVALSNTPVGVAYVLCYPKPISHDASTACLASDVAVLEADAFYRICRDPEFGPPLFVKV